MHKKKKIFILLSFLTVFSILFVVPPQAIGDGGIYVKPSTIDQWMSIPEEKQIGIINYHNNIEKLLIVINVKASTLNEGESAVWFFPVPSNPENVDIDKLPDIAFPQEYSTKKVHKDYPHHFVTDKDMLFLHSGLLLKVFAEAISKKAPEYVLNHLATHLQVIGMQSKIDEIKKAVDIVESMDKVQEVTNELTAELKGFFESIKSVNKLQNGNGKDKIIGNLVKDVSTKISDILKPLQNED